jgi:hypothetical protein
MSAEVNRRNFLKTAALAAGPAIISARGANGRSTSAGSAWARAATWPSTGCTRGAQRRRGHGRLRHLSGLHRARQGSREDRLGQRSRHLPGLSRPAGRPQRGRRLHHDARAPAPRHDHRGAPGRQARVPRKAAGPHHRGGFRNRARLAGVRQDRAGGHAEPQFVALQESQGTDRAGHDRRGALRARVLVPQLAARTIRRGAT